MIEKPVSFSFKVYPCGVEVTGIDPLPSVCPEHERDWPALVRIAGVLTQEMSLHQMFTGCEPLCVELLAAVRSQE